MDGTKRRPVTSIRGYIGAYGTQHEFRSPCKQRGEHMQCKVHTLPALGHLRTFCLFKGTEDRDEPGHSSKNLFLIKNENQPGKLWPFSFCLRLTLPGASEAPNFQQGWSRDPDCRKFNSIKFRNRPCCLGPLPHPQSRTLGLCVEPLFSSVYEYLFLKRSSCVSQELSHLKPM